MYSEICTILSYEMNLEILHLMRIQDESLQLTYYAKMTPRIFY
jgi:hypothetical protein